MAVHRSKGFVLDFKQSGSADVIARSQVANCLQWLTRLTSSCLDWISTLQQQAEDLLDIHTKDSGLGVSILAEKRLQAQCDVQSTDRNLTIADFCWNVWIKSSRNGQAWSDEIDNFAGAPPCPPQSKEGMKQEAASSDLKMP
ncbi:hypothetical protein PGT21_035435 [Puccinia graminis f. sp. tritici]|uniref:Uncharacterized protein n=1 Tax=Puccinia graminis f. sp. tritici TaxID=56615 RepID=A0A5B0P0K1_PUCGR|nr:hypothetical protein PGT21_035435 [Puccinia graminis f. sp. tritici]